MPITAHGRRLGFSAVARAQVIERRAQALALAFLHPVSEHQQRSQRQHEEPQDDPAADGHAEDGFGLGEQPVPQLRDERIGDRGDQYGDERDAIPALFRQQRARVLRHGLRRGGEEI